MFRPSYILLTAAAAIQKEQAKIVRFCLLYQLDRLYVSRCLMPSLVPPLGHSGTLISIL